MNYGGPQLNWKMRFGLGAIFVAIAIVLHILGII